MNRPMIGIIPLVDIERDSYWMLPGYMEGLIQAGGIPVMLPLLADQNMLEQVADQLDGFLFTGGHDVSPSMYQEAPLPFCGECCPLRDEMESMLFPILYEKDKPVLGICRGIQLINVLLGGTLFQDLPAQKSSGIEHHQPAPYDEPAHEVEIVCNTPLYRALKKNMISVNSCHHQGIKELSPELSAMARSADGLIEAVYAPRKKYLCAVQWHPEFLVRKDNNSREIFKDFVKAML